MTNVLDAARRLPRAFARLLAVAGLSLAAVAGSASDAAAQPGGMERMQQVFSDPAIANYRLTSGNLAKFMGAMQALQALEDEDIDLEDRFDMDDAEDINVGDIAAAFDSEPRIKGAINGAGLSSREFVTFLFSMMQAMFGSIAVQMGGEQALNDMPNGVLKDNIRFFLDNQDAFAALDMDHDEN